MLDLDYFTSPIFDNYLQIPFIWCNLWPFSKKVNIWKHQGMSWHTRIHRNVKLEFCTSETVSFPHVNTASDHPAIQHLEHRRQAGEQIVGSEVKRKSSALKMMLSWEMWKHLNWEVNV